MCEENETQVIEDDDTTLLLMSQTVPRYKLTDQQENAVQYFLFDTVCCGNKVMAYTKAGYDKNRPDHLRVSNANTFFKKKRIINRINELTGADSQITNVDMYTVDKMSATKDLKDALATFKRKIVEDKKESPAIVNAYVRLIDMQAKAARLYDEKEEAPLSDADKATEDATKMFLERAKSRQKVANE